MSPAENRSPVVKVANASAFWGDTPHAAKRLMEAVKDLDYITFDYLAEVSMSIMAIQRDKDPSLGYAHDFVKAVEELVPLWKAGHRCRLISNGGGLNPRGCAVAIASVLKGAGITRPMKVGLIEGDDVLAVMLENDRSRHYRNMETGEPFSTIAESAVSANAYLGASSITDALAAGCDIVVTGRAADPSLTVAALVHHHRWSWDDYDRIAAATLAGHLLECGCQASGGIATDWLEEQDNLDISFPIASVTADGTITMSKCPGSGGAVNTATIKEQMLYEIGDPDNYLSPDVRMSLSEVSVKETGDDAVTIQGARGAEPPLTYKVSATYRAGYKAEASLTIYGERAYDKGKRCAAAILARLERLGLSPREHVVECIGGGDVIPLHDEEARREELFECVMRIAVADADKGKVEAFTKEIAAMVTAGPPGTTGYSGGRAPVRPRFGYWPCRIDATLLRPSVSIIKVEATR